MTMANSANKITTQQISSESLCFPLLLNRLGSRLMERCMPCPAAYAPPSKLTQISRYRAISPVRVLGVPRIYRLNTCHTTASSIRAMITTRRFVTILSTCSLIIHGLFYLSNALNQLIELRFVLFKPVINDRYFFPEGLFIRTYDFNTGFFDHLQSLFFGLGP